MPRPRLCRKVAGHPKATYFKPRGVPLRDLEEATLSVEGLEALRLADLEGLTASEAARAMGVSRHTFGRVLAQARRAVADALVNALALRIEGGEYTVAEQGNSLPATTEHLPLNIVAVSAEGPLLSDRVAPRFGRAAGFVVVDLETMSSRFLDNGQSRAMAHGAGVWTAQRIAEAGAGVLLTGVIGARAFKALGRAGVRVGLILEGITVGQAVERYAAGLVPFVDRPNNQFR